MTLSLKPFPNAFPTILQSLEGVKDQNVYKVFFQLMLAIQQALTNISILENQNENSTESAVNSNTSSISTLNSDVTTINNNLNTITSNRIGGAGNTNIGTGTSVSATTGTITATYNQMALVFVYGGSGLLNMSGPSASNSGALAMTSLMSLGAFGNSFGIWLMNMPAGDFVTVTGTANTTSSSSIAVGVAVITLPYGD